MQRLVNRLKVLVSGKVEKMIADSIQQTEQGNYLSIDPQRFTKNTRINCKGSRTCCIDGSITGYSLFASNSNVFKTNDRAIFPSNSSIIVQ